MKLVELDVLKFLDVVDSNSPAPGGGSVSALASSLGASLARMVAHLSFGKKNYEALA
ncbi:MAG: cyclodeaminase/cyclohydrolase family protein, partial [Fusobacterium periodonticum]|nr:cyclodeaminase/cyclohydrolase family protein [Fusobacterium periodonticum]